MKLTELGRLPGPEDRNFEALTRAIVTRRFGALGTLRERRNQPGVEFYLQVDHAGALGDPGRVWGWSCKWFSLNSRNELSAGQRSLIKESVEKAVKYVEGLTDFVLCLPERPTAKDEKWIAELGPANGVSVEIWTTENYEAQLAGLDELRSTFFGELVLTPDTLAKVHARSVAPVAARWVAPLHTANHVELRIDQVLLRPESFARLNGHRDEIAERVGELRAGLSDIGDAAVRAAGAEIADDLKRFLGDVMAIVDAAQSLRPAEVRERLSDIQPPTTSPRALRRYVLALRKRRLPAALAATGLAAEIRDAVTWLQNARLDADASLIAIVGAAGQGKTHLSAQMTDPTEQPAAGVFIRGSRLSSGASLDDLARQIQGLRVDRFEDLLEALNAAGGRAGTRVPLFIDGLNEAEKPAQWRGLLDELVPALADYPFVVIVVTLREVLARHAVPDGAITLRLDWGRREVDDLVRSYFNHYLIDATDAWLPTGMFDNPLLLRMYCEAANHDRREPVGVEALPTSLIGVFELYLQGVVDRLAHDAVRVSIPPDQIRRRLAEVAHEMWKRGVRGLPFDDARRIIDAGETNWEESLYRRLEDEGIIFREETPGSTNTQTEFLFDRFAGYLIADALLAQMSPAEVGERLAETPLWETLLGSEAHPLGEDVAFSLVGLVPRRFTNRHVWPHAPAQHQSWVLSQELTTESQYLDDDTVNELALLLATPIPGDAEPRQRAGAHPFDRLWELRRSPTHRLNAAFLDRALRLLRLPDRDRKWTEWVRRNASDLILKDLGRAIEQWTATVERSDSDDLDALATAWLLTSTNRRVRDFATKALQRYGRPEPERLFELATKMLDVDDPYVVERVVGAACGASTARQLPDPGGQFEEAFGRWLTELRDRFLDGGTTPTSHELLRSYIRVTYQLAGKLHPSCVPDGVNPAAVTFAAVPRPPSMTATDPNAAECGRTIGMDFENYTIGSVIEGRENYDFDHPDFQRARSEVMGRVWALGWRAALFGTVDEAIARSDRRHSATRAPVERYGKKYGWIAYYEWIGRQADDGLIRDRWIAAGRNVAADIDPTFPIEPPAAPVQLPGWIPTSTTSDEESWLRDGTVNIPVALWEPGELYGSTDQWLLVEGYLAHKSRGRTVFGFFRTLLFEPDELDSAVGTIKGVEYPGNDFLPGLPEVWGAFAGEAPWSPNFEVRYGSDTQSNEYDEYPPRALRGDWREEGVKIGQVAVSFGADHSDSPAGLKGSYDVPSYEFAAHFGLRQLPGTLDLVGLDGVRASAAFRVDEPWRGHLLYIRRDLVMEFTGTR
ncbi:NACHT domain-containing protein [Cryptosporangium phraense]|uniref:ATP-binding protein n=1 Tax=Cryptosporangium phraense TaxID=2593070 RepID=A0A545ANC9_9ACTN|nr:ATP-binding protein [Cryptosporangium phraense]TQS42770.1 ATP-binding protein [Cryptosporangium phraense]